MRRGTGGNAGRGGQGGGDGGRGFARAAVGGGEEVEGVGWAEEGAEAAAGFGGLMRGLVGQGRGRGQDLAPAFGGEFNAVVGDALVDGSVFWGLC